MLRAATIEVNRVWTARLGATARSVRDDPRDRECADDKLDNHRRSVGSDGIVLVRLKTPWLDGTSHIALQPLELLEKLAALIPRPWVNLIVYHGVLAPNAKWRGEVVDFSRPRLERPSSATTPKKVVAPHNRTWAELMRRGLAIDVLECPDCGGRLRFVAAILLSSAIRRILRHIGLPSDTVQLSPAPAPPELDDAWAC